MIRIRHTCELCSTSHTAATIGLYGPDDALPTWLCDPCVLRLVKETPEGRATLAALADRLDGRTLRETGGVLPMLLRDLPPEEFAKLADADDADAFGAATRHIPNARMAQLWDGYYAARRERGEMV